MSIIKDNAVVLRVFEQGNTSQVVVFLCRRFGQARVLIKGSRRWAKKGFEGGFDLLQQGELVAYPRSGDRLWMFKEWEEQNHSPATFESFRRNKNLSGKLREGRRAAGFLYVVSYLCELVEAVTRAGVGADITEHNNTTNGNSAEQFYANLYSILSIYLQSFESRPDAYELLVPFTVDALIAAGTAPDFSVCGQCNKSVVADTSEKQNKAHALFLNYDGLFCHSCLYEFGQKILDATNFPSSSLDRLGRPEIIRLGIFGRLKGWGAGEEFRIDGKFLEPVLQSIINHKKATPPPGWLSPESCAALDCMRKTRKPVRLSKKAGFELSRLLRPLIHMGLEHDLRTVRVVERLIHKRIG